MLFEHLRLKKELKRLPCDILLVAGQSNAQGYGRGDSAFRYKPHAPVYQLTPRGGVALAKDTRYRGGSVGTSFALYFAQAYLDAGLLPPGRGLLVVNTAVGGTGFTDRRWGLHDDLYPRMLRMARRALALHPQNKITAFLWHQGETDVQNGMDPAAYAAALRTLICSARTALHIGQVPFVSGAMVPEWMQENPFSFEIAAATRSLMHSLPHCGYVESDGLAGNTRPDHIHFSRKSCAELGKRYFSAYAALRVGQAAQADGNALL